MNNFIRTLLELDESYGTMAGIASGRKMVLPPIMTKKKKSNLMNKIKSIFKSKKTD
jgi:hypothetical protein